MWAYILIDSSIFIYPGDGGQMGDDLRGLGLNFFKPVTHWVTSYTPCIESHCVSSGFTLGLRGPNQMFYKIL